MDAKPKPRMTKSPASPPAAAPSPQPPAAPPAMGLTALQSLLEERRAALAQALPRRMSVERFMRIVLTTVGRSPELQRCTPESLYACALYAAQLGLEPGLLNQAHLIPYWNSATKRYEAHFQLGYMGLRTLAERYGDITDGDAQIVREADEFRYQLGTEPAITHVPAMVQDRGAITHVYAWAKSRTGQLHLAVMTRQEIEQHRDKYVRRLPNGAFPPSWVESFEAMALKTVMIRCYKFLARTPELREAIALEERDEAGLPQNLGLPAEQEQLEQFRREARAQLAQAQPSPAADAEAPAEALPEASAQPESSLLL